MGTRYELFTNLREWVPGTSCSQEGGSGYQACVVHKREGEDTRCELFTRGREWVTGMSCSQDGGSGYQA